MVMGLSSLPPLPHVGLGVEFWDSAHFRPSPISDSALNLGTQLTSAPPPHFGLGVEIWDSAHFRPSPISDSALKFGTQLTSTSAPPPFRTRRLISGLSSLPPLPPISDSALNFGTQLTSDSPIWGSAHSPSPHFGLGVESWDSAHFCPSPTHFGLCVEFWGSAHSRFPRVGTQLTSDSPVWDSAHSPSPQFGLSVEFWDSAHFLFPVLLIPKGEAFTC